MKLMNNPEVKKLLLITFIPVIIISIAMLFFSPYVSLTIVSTSVFFASAFLVFLKIRYKRISELTQSIDSILSGNDSIDIESYSEGELSVLENDVRKMLSRLRSQTDVLVKDKEYLADSIADISHQIRTPLTSINLILTLLSSEDITKEKRDELMLELSSLISKTEYLVAVLLKISKIDAGAVQFEMKETDLYTLIMKSVEPVMIPMDIKNQTFVTDVTDIKLVCDAQWCSEAFGNILKNCAEHTPEGGKITVTARNTPIFTEIIITDNGSGFNDEDMPHIFERFYKGKNSSKDSFGIGLNLAKMIINRQNGTVTAENNTDGGAKFTVKLYKQIV